jgi:hypothetical protein
MSDSDLRQFHFENFFEISFFRNFVTKENISLAVQGLSNETKTSLTLIRSISVSHGQRLHTVHKLVVGLGLVG